MRKGLCMSTPKERERQRKRRATAKERGRKIVEAARARARKIVEAARARARQLLASVSRPRERKAPTKRRTKATPKPKPKVRTMKADQPQPLANYNTFLDALRKVTGRSQGLISIRDVRKASGLPKAVFDAVALRLAAERAIVLHEHDFPLSLSAAQRAELVEDPRGRVFVGMALPPSVLPSVFCDKILAKAKLYGEGKPVPIASLRKDVGLAAAQFDFALTELQRLGKVALYRDDNRATAKDAGAYFAAGEPRHILYVKG